MIALKIIGIVVGIVVLLYLLAIMPGLARQGERSKFTNVYYAHRGLHDNEGDAPENSMEAFRKAVEYGYGIELDIRLTKDLIPVVFHDGNLERMCGRPEKICDCTYEEIKDLRLANSEQTIPLFEEVLKLVKGRVPLIVEYKVDWTDLSICPIADKMLRKYQGLYCIESFNPLVLLWYRRHHKAVFRGQLSGALASSGMQKGLLYVALEHLLFNGLTKPDFIAYDHRFAGNLSRTICRRLYRNLAVAWTVQSQKDMDEAKKNFEMFIFDSFIPK